MNAPFPDPRGLRAVALAFLTNRDKILLYRRDAKPKCYPRVWAMLGGQVEPGETPEQGLLRELQEEIGAQPTTLSFVRTIDVIGHENCEDHVIYLFKGKINKSLAELHLTEGEALDYFTRSEFEALEFPKFLRSFLNDLMPTT
jgi:8-oxo-dGTP diphosphatase